jgi:nucleotide-binding universal stress UspA family protein
MAWKDIIVHFGDTKASDVRLKTALALAKSQKARVTGLYIIPFPPIIAGMDENMDPGLMDTMIKAGRERAAVAKKSFLALTKKSGVRCLWKQVEGSPMDVLSRHGRYADLVVVGQHDNEATFDMDRRGLPDEVILNIGRPVLVVPRTGSHAVVGRKPVVAWNGSSVAARALGDAMPFLEKAKKATVLAVKSKDLPKTAKKNGEGSIIEHLAHHGVKAKLETVQAEDPKDGQTLLTAASRRGADLLIMGAYGHWRLKELVLGGVTEHVLAHAKIPVLMSH